MPHTTGLQSLLLLLLLLPRSPLEYLYHQYANSTAVLLAAIVVTCTAQLRFGVCSALAVTVTVTAAAVTAATSERHLTSRLAQFNLVHL
jgi:hypothetical protein